MEERNIDTLKYSDLFKALGDANRLQIWMMLKEGRKCAGDFLKELNISQSTLSHHLKLLAEAEWIVSAREGKTLYYSANSHTVSACRKILEPMRETVRMRGVPATESRIETVLSKVLEKTVNYMCLIDLEEDTYRIIENTDEGITLSERLPNASGSLRSSLGFLLRGRDEAAGYAFADLHTLKERMKGEDKAGISFAFESAGMGWIKASFMAMAYAEDGALAEAVYFLQDITEEKKEEQNCRKELFLLREKEGLEKRRRKELMTSLSANLRNPLKDIAGTVDRVREAANDSEKVLDCAENIENASHNLLALIKDLSETVEIESGELSFTEEANNMWEIFRDVDSIIGSAADRANVIFTGINSGRILHSDILCSGAHLRYLLCKLLSSAIESCGSGERVILDIKEQDMLGDKASYLITISDNGKGNRCEKELPLCRKIVEKMGGVIQIADKPGTEHKVSLLLPFAIDMTAQTAGQGR